MARPGESVRDHRPRGLVGRSGCETMALELPWMAVWQGDGEVEVV